MVLGLKVAWTLLIVWSLISLVLFRSTAGHGPDVVGEEMSRFLVPLVAALAVATVYCFSTPRRRRSRWSPVFATVAIVVAEIVVYCALVMR